MDGTVFSVKEELDRVNKKISDIRFESEQIKEAMSCFLTSGSKRIRTILTALYLKANGCGNLSEDSINVVTAGEVIHNASLLHDDVLDGAKIRREQPAFCEIYTPQVSILSGDYLLSIATEQLLKVNNTEILKIFLKCTKEMCRAEIDQFFLRGALPSFEEYINICEGKTAKLFEAVMESCALLEKVNINKAREFASKFGILFQLKNDLAGNSEKLDRQNKIYTLKDILGIEKTMDLMDNYFVRLRGDIGELPDNIYKKGLEELLKSL